MEIKKLIEIADVVDSLHQTPEYTDKGIPMVRVTDVKSGDLSLQDCLCVSEDVFDKFTAKHVPCEGDIVISRVGTYGNFSYVSSDEKFCLGQNTAIIIPHINSRYLYYYLLSPMMKVQIESRVVGSTQKTLSLKNIKDLDIPCFEKSKQDKIASILESIDKKIKNNNRINRNLQEQLKTLFSSWFYDMTPFGGNVPEGTQFIPLEELCSVITKGTTPTTLGMAFTDNGINFIKGETILDNHGFDRTKLAFVDEETHEKLKRSQINNGDILFTIAGTLGRFALVDDSMIPANTNQAVAILRASKVSPEYVYSFFLGNWHNEYYTKRIQQAVQANLSLGTIKSLPIMVLKKDLYEEYLEIITPLITETKKIELEILKLSELRDTLLPKLISGDLDVSDLEV